MADAKRKITCDARILGVNPVASTSQAWTIEIGGRREGDRDTNLLVGSRNGFRAVGKCQGKRGRTECRCCDGADL